VVGGDLPDLDPITIKLAPNDVLIMATDGIQEHFADSLPSDLTTAATCRAHFQSLREIH